MKRRSIAAAILAMCCAMMFCANAGDASKKKADGERPIAFALGADDGGLGVTVKGSWFYDVTPARWNRPHARIASSTYLYVNPDMNFTKLPLKTNPVSLSLRPAYQFGIQPDTGGFGRYPDPKLWPYGAPAGSLYLDLRKQYGTFKGKEIDNTLLGAGATIAVPIFTRWVQRTADRTAEGWDPFALPMIHATWYKVIEHSSQVPAVPEGIKTDMIDVAFKTSLSYKPKSPAKIFGREVKIIPQLDLDLDSSRPTEGATRGWKSRIDVAVSASFNGKALNPILSYTSGEKLAIHYDRQVLLGIAWNLVRGK